MSTKDVRPPVNEVVISTSFESQAALDGPRLMVGMSDVLDELPDVTEVPPYEMAIERPFDEQVLQPAAPQIQFIGSSQMQRRLWFTKNDDPAFLLQVQSNYLALNWRRQDGGPDYPGFEGLRSKFDHFLRLIEAACVGGGGKPLVLRQIEITYINILSPDSTWGGFRDIDHVISVRVPGMSRFENLNVGYSQAIEDDASGEFVGRVHVAVSTGYQSKTINERELRALSIRDLSPVLNLSITARSGQFAGVKEDLGPRFGTAHVAVEDAFRAITTDDARRNWGLL